MNLETRIKKLESTHGQEIVFVLKKDAEAEEQALKRAKVDPGLSVLFCTEQEKNLL